MWGLRRFGLHLRLNFIESLLNIVNTAVALKDLLGELFHLLG